MKAANQNNNRRDLSDAAIALIEAQMLAITFIGPIAAQFFPLDASFWAVIFGIGLTFAMILEVHLRRPQFALAAARIKAVRGQGSAEMHAVKAAHAFGI